MPVITTEGPKLTKDQKEQISREFTESSAKIMNIDKQAFVIIIKENDLDNIALGGELISEKLKRH